MRVAIPNNAVLVGWSDKPEVLLLDRANRHGVVAGATGTGKTVTLQVLAEALSDAGVPVFAADVKGDLSGISPAGSQSGPVSGRAPKKMGIDLKPASPPVIFWDLFGKKGHPVRATISEMGPLLMGRLLALNDVQAGVLNIVFHVADQEGLLLLDLKDLQAALKHIADNAQEIGTQYGNVAPSSIGAIQRALLSLETQGATNFFGEPALQLSDLMRVDASGKGYVSVLAADTLMESPALYSTFLLWLMSELFEQLPEVGDPEKPRLVFFFDEAHLLFKDAPKALLDKIEQVVRLIRSKGIGIYFVTQNPADIPDAVLAQLGNRIQHGLRAYTPADQAGLKAAAQSFRANPAFDTAKAIQELGVGEALVSTLDESGAPSIVQKTQIRPPASRIGPALPQERADIMARSPVRGIYDNAIDRESAFEKLRVRTVQPAADRAPPQQQYSARDADPRRTQPRPSNRQSIGEAFAKSLVRGMASSVGRQLIRGVLGSLTR